MKVLFITNLYPPYFLGGYEVACKDIAEEFKRNGHLVSVLTSTYGIKYPLEHNGVYRILSVKTDFKGYKSISEKTLSLFYNPYNYKKTCDVLKKVKPDVASVWSISGISCSPIFALQKLRIPFVIHLFDRSLSFIRKKGWKNIVNPFFSERLRLNHIISCSESLKSDYIKRGFKDGSITTIYHGIIPEESVLEDKPTDKDNLKLLFVGQLWEAKGADLAIRTLQFLEKNGIFANLTIVGDGKESYKNYLKKIIKECSVIERVSFVGKISREALKDFYRNHDILLFPTYSWYKEPFGIVILEAMNQGIPVIASNCGGPKEIIDDGMNGLLFVPDSIESMYSKIELLSNDRNLQAEIRKNAFDIIRSKFVISNIGIKTIKYYLKAMDKYEYNKI